MFKAKPTFIDVIARETVFRVLMEKTEILVKSFRTLEKDVFSRIN